MAELVASAVAEQATQTWPADPYKGLTFFGMQDAPLFAGRVDDVRSVHQLLSKGRARILLLHGTTGCGKSSFLRAGLIPFSEEKTGAFRFARDPDHEATALFVRASESPVDRLAEKVHLYVVHAIDAQNELSFRDSAMLSGLRETDPVEFVEKCYEEPDYLVSVLEQISIHQPRTPVLIVDQAEEVLTLYPGEKGRAPRDRFFEFLSFLSAANFDFKMIVTFRDEYHGIFYSKMRAAGADAAQIQDYFLGELTREQLIQAIERPTSTDPVVGYRGIPLEVYGFKFEKGLAARIAEDLLEENANGSLLPVLQIVCRQLYELAKEKRSLQRGADAHKPVEITKTEYTRIGAIEGQVDRYLQQALRESLSATHWRQREPMRWRDILSALARRWPDGNVTTDVKSHKDLLEEARKANTALDFDQAMKALEHDKWKIIRQISWLERGTGRPITCYSLGHDVLGTVLDRWKIGRDEDRQTIRRLLLTYGIVLIGVCFFVGNDLAQTRLPIVNIGVSLMQVIGILAGAALLLLAGIPNKPWSLWIYRPLYGWLLDAMARRRLP